MSYYALFCFFARVLGQTFSQKRTKKAVVYLVASLLLFSQIKKLGSVQKRLEFYLANLYDDNF